MMQQWAELSGWAEGWGKGDTVAQGGVIKKSRSGILGGFGLWLSCSCCAD